MKKLYEAAKKVRKNSYSPYSKWKVGASILMKDGRIFSGCNVENSTYGATVCAERVAIWKAVSEGATEIQEVCVVTDANPAWPPCGLCRQVITEFGGPEVIVHLSNLKGVQVSMEMSKLMPFAFKPDRLLKKNKSKKK